MDTENGKRKMEYNLTEDEYKEYYVEAICANLSRKEPDLAMDCSNFEKFANKEDTIIVRDVSKDFQEPPMVRISHMLNDEAPDNFLSSAALEKNIFSDDDEFGLHKLKKSLKNLVNPTWDMDLNTEDVVKRESTLELDYVNFPPPPPPCGSSSDMDQENVSDQLSKQERYNQPVILYEVSTDGAILDRVYGSENKLKSDQNMKASCSNHAHENDTEESISSVMNDHNYISQKIPINECKIVLQNLYKDLRDGKVEINKSEMSGCRDEVSLIAALLKEKMDRSEKDYVSEAVHDDDACSSASTEPYMEGMNEDDDCDNDEEVASDDDLCDKPNNLFPNICKEELIIEESEPIKSSGNVRCNTEGVSENSSSPVSPFAVMDQSPQQEKTVPASENIVRLKNGAVDTPASDIPASDTPASDTPANDTPASDTPASDTPASECSKTTEETSSISIAFSENRSEPNEFLETEDFALTDTENDQVGENNAEPIVIPTINAITTNCDDPKLIELKEFGTKLIELCNTTTSNENLQEIMNKLLVEFKKIIGTPESLDASVQTEKFISKDKRTKMNEKAKKRLLNEESSDSSSSDDDECDRVEKSPSYSDLSGRASSEEYLNTELDENVEINEDNQYHRSVNDGIDLSKNCEVSENGAHTEEGDGLDLSKYEESSAHTSSEKTEKETDKDHPPSESSGTVEQNSEIVVEPESNHILPTSVEMENVDEEMKDVADKVAHENMSEDNMHGIEGEDKENEDIGQNYDQNKPMSVDDDEKLKVDPVVVVNKLSETELEGFYDDIRDKEIDKLLKFSGLIKRKSTDTVYTYADRNQPPLRSSKTKKLFEILKEAEDDICSDESNSDVEENIISEQEFLMRCNTKAKQDFLKASSSDSEIESKITDEEDMEVNNLSDYSSSNDSTNHPSIVDKFLKKLSETSTELTDEAGSVAVTEVDAEVNKSGNNNKSIEQNISSLSIDEQNQNVNVRVPAIEKSIQLNDSTEDLSLGANAEEVVEVDGKTSEKTDVVSDKEVGDDNSVGSSVTSKPSTSRGYGLIRSLLEEKEIDLDAISAIGRKDDSNTNTSTIDSGQIDADILDSSLCRRPASTKSLETLMEEVKRRQIAKSTDTNIVTVNVDSDSDLEEISIEPEAQTRTIKPMLRKDQLAGETRVAQRRENERLKRLEKKNESLTKLINENSDPTIRENKMILDYNSETKSFIKVHPDIVRHLKPHQVDGIKFMYDNCYGSVDFLKKHPGSGCILAHCMGLGKTLQLIALLHTVITHKELNTSKILVLCPKSTVMNWADEIRRWLGPLKCNNLKIFNFLDISGIQEKLGTLQEWSCSGKPGFRQAGCLLMGYEAFRILVFYHLYKKRNVPPSQVEKIKEKIRETLLEPGADLVICDEGHIIKNRKSATSLAVSEINTLRRIILTGTPIQNNLKEYYAMVNFIKPKFLGTEKEFANLYANPIKNGQHKDSNKRDIKIMKQRSFVLHKKLSKFVQRREAALLKTFLPQKYEYVLFVPMTDIQNELYEFFLEASSKREGSKGKTLIPDYTCLRKIWTHPRVLENAWRNAVLKNKRENKKSPIRDPNSDDEVPDDVYDTQTGALSVTDDWWRSILSEEHLKSILPSTKLKTMFEILRMCEENGEKCLIFSAFVAVLDCVEYFMNEINKQPTDSRVYGLSMFGGSWVSGKDYYRLDGKTPKSIRHEMVKRFNDPASVRARVFLISAKAGGQGINLIGANRVIILDTSWNPSNDQQNIFRVFRLGQKRKCFVYRLIAMGTMEEKVYSRSVTKQAMSFRVVDEQQIDRHYSMAELTELYTLTKPDFQNRPTPLLPHDSILASLLRNSPHLVYKYHEHDSLLENKLEQELSEQEKADAWDAYEKDLQYSQNPDFLSSMNSMPQMMQNPGNYMPPGLGYGAYQQGVNYPLNYGGNMPQGLLAGMGFPATSSLMDMFNMFPSYPSNSSQMMAALNQSNAGNMGQPYGSGGLPSTSSSVPLNLPAFSTLQNMVQSTGMSTMPSFTTPYSTMAGSSGYNLSTDPALLSLGQMLAHNYRPSLNMNPGSNLSMDPRPNLPGPSINTPPISDTRKSPFPPSLVVPTTTAESIPTSVIMKPPQTHPLALQTYTTQSPQAQSQSKLQPHLQQQHQAQSQHQIQSPVTRSVSPKPHIVKNQLTNAISLSGSSVQNRNSSPVTVSRNSPQLKSAGSAATVRGTNMGIVYPDQNAATITPIVAATTPTKSAGNISQAALANTNISVRSVSSINNNSNVTQATKSPPPIRNSGSLPAGVASLKQNNIGARQSAISPNTTSASFNKQISAINIQKPTLGKHPLHNNSVATQNLQSASSSLNPIQQLAQKQDRNTVKYGGMTMDKSQIHFLSSNNVQLTKVSNKSVGNKSNYQTSPPQIQTVGRSPISTQLPLTSGSNSVITKARGGSSSVTVLPVQNSSQTTKLLQNKHQNVVPTLAPLSSKASTRIVPTNSILSSGTSISTTKPATQLSTYGKSLPSSPSTHTSRKNNSNVIRVGATVTKPFQPSSATTIKRTTVRPTINLTSSASSNLISTSTSLPNLSKLTPNTAPSIQQSRPPNSQMTIAQLRTQNPQSLLTSKQQNSTANSLSGRSSVSIRPIENINKFTNAGITISPGPKMNANNQSVLINRAGSTSSAAPPPPYTISSGGTGSNANNTITLSKLLASRKRPAPNVAQFVLPENSPISVRQVKKPRLGQTALDRTAESLMRARSGQGLTILPRNMSQANQRLTKDGKLTDVVEID